MRGFTEDPELSCFPMGSLCPCAYKSIVDSLYPVVTENKQPFSKHNLHIIWWYPLMILHFLYACIIVNKMTMSGNF